MRLARRRQSLQYWQIHSPDHRKQRISDTVNLIAGCDRSLINRLPRRRHANFLRLQKSDAKGISDLATKSGLNRENMYRILSEKGNPQLGSLSVLLESMGLKLVVEVKKSKAA